MRGNEKKKIGEKCLKYATGESNVFIGYKKTIGIEHIGKQVLTLFNIRGTEKVRELEQRSILSLRKFERLNEVASFQVFL